jgi:tetratricopeptide (TPR) repeat protein
MEPRGLLARLWAWGLVALLALPSAAGAAGPLERDHPLVQKGREAYAAGNYEEALKAFEAAKQERPNDPAVDFNRGDALAKLGRIPEAREVFRSVTESNRPDLRQKAWYNLGNLHATTGDRQEALKAYRRALTLDPKDVQARHNYEVVLRNLPPPQNDNKPDGGADGGTDGGSDGGRPDAGQDGGTPGDGGTPQDGGTDGGADGGEDGGAGDGGADGGADGGPADGGADGGAGDGGADGGQQGPPQQGDGGADGGADGGQDDGQGEHPDGGSDGGSAGEQDADGSADGGASPADLDRQEAERLLDAMKQNEKNLQLWRFQQKKKQRKPNEKDW